MNRIVYILFLSVIVLMFPSCSKDDGGEKEEKPDTPTPVVPTDPEYPTFEKPNWSVNDNSFEYNMTAIVQLPDSLSSSEQQADLLAVFKDKECRGIGERIYISDKRYVWMIMVYSNNADEQLSFMYYSSKSKHKYKSASTITFSNDGKYGTVDKPVVIGMTIINVSSV